MLTAMTTTASRRAASGRPSVGWAVRAFGPRRVRAERDVVPGRPLARRRSPQPTSRVDVGDATVHVPSSSHGKSTGAVVCATRAPRRTAVPR